MHMEKKNHRASERKKTSLNHQEKKLGFLWFQTHTHTQWSQW